MIDTAGTTKRPTLQDKGPNNKILILAPKLWPDKRTVNFISFALFLMLCIGRKKQGLFSLQWLQSVCCHYFVVSRWLSWRRQIPVGFVPQKYEYLSQINIHLWICNRQYNHSRIIILKYEAILAVLKDQITKKSNYKT